MTDILLDSAKMGAAAPDARLLLSCPFCGATAQWVEDNGGFDRPFGLVVEHSEACFMTGRMMSDWDTIIAAWNTRATPPAASESAVPVAWCSPGQLANLMDVDQDGGVYLPIRKTQRGNFTMPLFATAPKVVTDTGTLAGKLREKMARIVNPSAFASRQSLHDYCISQGDTEDEARKIADDTHKPDCEKAFAKADAILAILDGTQFDAKGVAAQ